MLDKFIEDCKTHHEESTSGHNTICNLSNQMDKVKNQLKDMETVTNSVFIMSILKTFMTVVLISLMLIVTCSTNTIWDMSLENKYKLEEIRHEQRMHKGE